MVVDTFTRPKGIEHPDATTDWLENLVSPKTQADFTILKGSIAPNNDVPASTYSEFAASAAPPRRSRPSRWSRRRFTAPWRHSPSSTTGWTS